MHEIAMCRWPVNPSSCAEGHRLSQHMGNDTNRNAMEEVPFLQRGRVAQGKRDEYWYKIHCSGIGGAFLAGSSSDTPSVAPADG